jgi:tripartite-type tricarboxylate transporter receptor subunit TctC
MQPSKVSVVLAAFCVTLASSAMGADYPTKPITLIVPYPPGGPTDIAGRVVAERLPARLGQTIVVVNRPGAATAIGVEQLAQSTPDGYTIGMVASGLPLLPITSKAFKLDIHRDLVPITQIMGGPLVLAVTSALPQKTVKEFIDYAKRNPGKLNFAAGGASDSLANDVLKSAAGISSETILYNGGAPVLQALAANEAQYALVPVSTGKPHVDAGKIRFLAVTGTKRFSLAPELPTMPEAGVSGFSITAWYGLAGPRGLPREIVNALHAATVEIVKSPEVSARLLQVAGMEVVGSTPDEFGRLIAADHDLWSKAAQRAGVKPQ